jgi:hypothetical protein
MYSLITPYMVHLRYGLPLAALALVVAYWLAYRWENRSYRGVLAVSLIALSVLSLFFYTHDNYPAGKYFNDYEFYHYYLGAKYHDELGYEHLYDASYIALRELEHPSLPERVRDLDTSRIVRTSTLHAKADAIKDRFSPARWEEWKADTLWFRGLFRGDRIWNRMLRDKGLNATPVWIMVAQPLVNTFSVDGAWNIHLLPWVDVGYALIAFGCLWRAFGIRLTAFVFLLIFTHYVTSQWPLKAAFMRLDWVMALLCAASMLKMKRYRWAGFFVAFATCMRVFPVLFAFGIAAKLILEFLVQRKLNQDYVRFFVSATITGTALVVCSILALGGLGSWSEFIEKILEHNDDIAAWRIGFKYVFLTAYNGDGGLWEMPYKDVLEQYGWALRILQGVVVTLCFGLCYRLRDEEALCFGLIPVFALTASTYYYFIFLCVPFLFFAGRVERWPYSLGMMLMFATAAIGHHGYLTWGRTWPLFFTLSVCVAVTCLYMMALAGVQAWKGPEEEVPGEASQD